MEREESERSVREMNQPSLMISLLLLSSQNHLGHKIRCAEYSPNELTIYFKQTSSPSATEAARLEGTYLCFMLTLFMIFVS